MVRGELGSGGGGASRWKLVGIYSSPCQARRDATRPGSRFQSLPMTPGFQRPAENLEGVGAVNSRYLGTAGLRK